MSQTTFFHPTSKATPDFWASVGIPARGAKLYSALQEGLPYNVYAKLAELTGLDKGQLARVVQIAPATLQRRIKSGHFNQDESDRLYRLARVFNAACELFEGDTEGAQTWLNSSIRGLGGSRPIDMIITSAETSAVLDLIGRLEHGVFA